MPDGTSVERPAASSLLVELDDYLLSIDPDARCLRASEMANPYGRRFVAGWRLPLLTESAGLRLFDVLVDHDQPYTVPTIFLVDPPPVNTWPHVESDGKLCLPLNGSLPEGTGIVELVRLQLLSACELVDAGASGQNSADFQAEFLSYWRQATTLGSSPVLSLISPGPPSRLIAACKLDGMTVVGETNDELARWLANYSNKGGTYKLVQAVFAWMDAPLLPSDYPNRTSEFRTLIRRLAPEAEHLLNQLAAEVPRDIQVVLGAPTDSGPCLASVLVREGAALVTPIRRSSYIERGFPPGKVPTQLKGQRWIGASRLERSSVERADAEWVHGRGQNMALPRLRQATVGILGCGSVGGPVAELLAAAGVGNFVTADPDAMSAANTGRHPLGMRYVLAGKAGAIAAQLRGRFPSILSIRPFASRWQKLDPAVLLGCDLLVSAIGSWADEAVLNDWHLASGQTVPVLYTWTEPRACAGHAVLIGGHGGCFACGFTPGGSPKFEVTQWSDSDVVISEPACGAFFSPYGPVELSAITTLAAELALDALLGHAQPGQHRIWAGRKARLVREGGRWTNAWLSGDGPREQGGLTDERAWPSGPCQACGHFSKP